MKQVRGPESGVRSPDRVSEVPTQDTPPRFRLRTPDSGPRTLLILIVVGSLLSVYPLQQSIDNQLSAVQSQREELIFLPSEARFSRISGGYSGLLAAIYWTRAVQYYGRHRLAHAKEFALLGTLLDIATNLDPHLVIAYRFGSLFLAGKPPEGAGDPQRAIHLLERGIVNNPEYWRLWEDLGFIYYWDMKDYAHAARAFQTGSERPGALPWMRVLAASVAAAGGEFQTSRILWTEIGRTAENDSIRRSAQIHLAALNTQEALHELDGLLAAFQKKEGRQARSMQDLVAAGYLRGIPNDLSGEPFVIGPDGHARLGPKTRIDLSLGQ
jgi:tetratricopeptide (TPR) repeat protein